MKIDTDTKKIEEILTRSIDTVYPTKEAMREALQSGKQLSIYVGIDATGDYVHIGHATNYLILERLHKLGHKIIVLVGDFTAMIGDPSDKTAARIKLTREQVLENVKTFKEQIGKILDFDNEENPIEFKFNSEWLSKLSLEQLADLGSNFTVQQMLERDMFKKRITENKPLYVHEFFYPLMQGYDSVAMGVDVEMGGTDQTFNMLAGRTLVKRYLNREKFVITTTLLVNPATGEKMMSKSLGTGIGLNESSESMFGKTMALPDEGIVQVFLDCTRLTMDEVDKKKQRLENGENPRDVKLELAHEIVQMYHGREAADIAQQDWEATFTNAGMPMNLQEIKVAANTLLLDAIVEGGLIESKTEGRRLFEEGAIRNAETDEKIQDSESVLNSTIVLKIGKKRFVKFVME